jgi:murein DD-endopeptidase MepM/ murein hydrolase activator NlpD
MAENASGQDQTNGSSRRSPRRRTVGEVWDELGRRGLRATLSRYASHAALLVVIGVGVWAARSGLITLPAMPFQTQAAVSETATPSVALSALQIADLPSFQVASGSSGAVARVAELHTVMPERPRLQIVKYAVQAGDTLFGIADQFGLKPASILWGNWEALSGDPHTLTPGQELNIPPVDGPLHEWSEGESLERVATFYGVTLQEILEWPGNDFDPAEDPDTIEIKAGTAIVVPGGKRETPSWRTPRITRANPASAKILGAGYCGQVVDGPTGTGSFVWPTASKWISGYTFDPDTHPAIDLGGSIGTAIFASDTGVVVYSGWNDWGYGYVVVIDHGTGWQTLYAHLSSINVGCGQAVYQGAVIGGMGCTGNCSGPHVHFEMMSDSYGKVNPVGFLP